MGFKPLTYNTPPEEEAHIFAEDDAAIFQSIFGEDGVFAMGDQMKATVINNNQVRVGNGILCVGGHIGRTVYGDYSDMTIENGEISKNRNDIITAVFSTTGEKGIDKFKIEVKKGTPGVVAEDPELTKENLYEGGKLRELPLWRVKLEGINIIEVEQMFKIIPKIPDLEEMIESLNGKSIIESGSNNNGYYRKYADGTLEMWGNIEIKFTFAGDKWGNDFYISRQRKVTFPVPSLTEAIVNINAWNNSICFVNLSTLANNRTEFAVYMVKGSGADYDSSVYWHAFGTWK